ARDLPSVDLCPTEISLWGRSAMRSPYKSCNLGLMPRLLSDMRHAVRLLRKDAVFACMAVFSIVLGLTACSSVFSIFNGLWLRSLPYPNADRLVELQETATAYKIFNRAVPLQNLHAWQTSTAFSQMAGFSLDGSYLTGFGPTAPVMVANVTQSLASTLGIQPIL